MVNLWKTEWFKVEKEAESCPVIALFTELKERQRKKEEKCRERVNERERQLKLGLAFSITSPKVPINILQRSVKTVQKVQETQVCEFVTK